MDDQEKYALYKQAQESGGPCPICNWKDGNGTRTCFYSETLGIVTHQNSRSALEADLTGSQRSLMRSYDSLHNEFEHSHDPTQCVTAVDYRGKPFQGNFRVMHSCGGQFVQQFEDMGEWRCTGCGEVARQTQPRELFWGHKHVEGDHRACVQQGEYYRFPHLCGGTGEFAGPYHIVCNGCDEEVKLWEHGIDYDVG